MRSFKLAAGIALSFALLFAAQLSFAQLTTTGAGKKPGGAAAYVGPGDVVSGAYAWYGFRAYNVADKGNRLINVCNVGDVVCADMSSDATTGALIVTTIGGSSCAIVACTIKTMYDRSGANNCSAAPCDVTLATIAQRPAFVVNCVGGKPCGLGSLSNTVQLVSGAMNFGSATLTWSAVANRIGDTTSYSGIAAIVGGDCAAMFDTTVNNVLAYCGSTAPIAAANDNAFHALQYVMNTGTSSTIYVDGASNSLANPGSSTAGAGQITVFAQGPNQGNCTCYIAEVGIWQNILFNGTQQANMNSNQRSYWGF